jgi:hypothetical protein
MGFEVCDASVELWPEVPPYEAPEPEPLVPPDDPAPAPDIPPGRPDDPAPDMPPDDPAPEPDEPAPEPDEPAPMPLVPPLDPAPEAPAPEPGDPAACGIGDCPTLPTDVPAEILAAETVSEPLPLLWSLFWFEVFWFEVPPGEADLFASFFC